MRRLGSIRPKKRLGRVAVSLAAATAVLCCLIVRHQLFRTPFKPQPFRFLSRRTHAWDKLQREGLFHANSGYPRVVPQSKQQAEAWEYWQDKVKKEWPSGCKEVQNDHGAQKQCLPSLFIIGQVRCLWRSNSH